MSSVRILVSYRGRLVTVQWRDWATPWRGDQMSHYEGWRISCVCTNALRKTQMPF